MEKLKKILDSETNKWIVKKAKPQVFGIIIMSVIFGGMAYLGVAVATLSRGIVDSAVNSDVGGIVYFAIILISLTIAQLVIRIISKVLTFNVSSKLEISIKQDIFDNIIRKKYNEISSIHTGELLNRITSDVSVLVSSIISIVPNMVYFIVKLVGVFVVLFAIDKTFSLVFIFGGALMFVVVLLFKSKMKTLHKAVQESDGKTRSFFQEIFSCPIHPIRLLSSALPARLWAVFKAILPLSPRTIWAVLRLKPLWNAQASAPSWSPK